MLLIINKKDISFGHNQNRNLHTTCHQTQYLGLTLHCSLTVFSHFSHVQVFVQVSCPLLQHRGGALSAVRGPQVSLLRPGCPGGSLHRVQAQRQQRPQRPPGDQPPLPQGLGPRTRVFRKQSHLYTLKRASRERLIERIT